MQKITAQIMPRQRISGVIRPCSGSAGGGGGGDHILKQIGSYSRRVLTNDNYDEEENGYILLLNSTETDISAGTYYYNIKLQRSDGEYEPIILTNEFIIME